MKKNLILTSIIAMVFVCPAIAAPSNTSSTFPANGKMLEDYAYTGQATYTNMHSYTGPVTADATYGDCPSGYPHTDAGATSADECWVACTAADTGISHANAATGKNFYGSGITDTCEVTGCETGYHLKASVPDLTTIIGQAEGDSPAGINNDGEFSSDDGRQEAKYGLTSSDRNVFLVDYGNAGQLRGLGRCSTQGGTSAYDTASAANVTTASDVTAAFGTGTNCWCKLTQYTPSGGTQNTLSGKWVLVLDYTLWDMDAEGCAEECVFACGDLSFYYEGANQVFRAAMFGSLGTPRPAACEANTIQITWADADQSDIDANEAGTVTYGGDIRTPKKAVHKPGKIFTGWTFNTPSGN